MKNFFKELWGFMRARKRYWLLPIILLLALFTGLFILLEAKTVTPFIYTVF